MQAQPEIGHLSGHHRETIGQIFQHPVGHNIAWQSVVSLLESIAQVEEMHNSKLLITLGTETETFEPPRHKDLDAQQVVDLRRMLKNAGYQDALSETTDPPQVSVSTKTTK
jgi:hypothetical protein